MLIAFDSPEFYIDDMDPSNPGRLLETRLRDERHPETIERNSPDKARHGAVFQDRHLRV